MIDTVEIQEAFRSYSFRGGSRLDIDPIELSDDQYLFLQNGRVRYGSLAPVMSPKDISTGLPLGKRQGLRIVGDFLFVFINGRCFFRDLTSAETTFFGISGFQMSATADRIYTALLPGSTVNFKRETDEQENPSSLIKLTDPIAPSPVVIICQDGASRPMLIFDINHVDEASDIEDWNKDTNREYVPVGLDMVYLEGKLFVLSPSRKEIYQSVSGRPLDFVVAVDNEGNKLSDLPSNGIEASRLSHAVDFEEITGLDLVPNNLAIQSVIGTDPQDFFLAYTRDKTHVVVLDYLRTIYGEPTFRTRFLFPTAPINQFSGADLLGDHGFIDISGLKSFNSISSFGEEGVNSEFSKSFDKYFKETLVQDVTAAESHDNYAFFAVKTVYGYKIIVFDNLTKRFIALDDWGLASPIFQFAAAKIDKIRRLFFMTDDSRVYEAFAGADVLQRIFFTKEFIGQEGMVSIKPTLVKVFTQNCKKSGTIILTEYVDRLKGSSKSEIIAKNITNEFIEPPYGLANEDSVVSVDYGLIETRSGVKCSVKLDFTLDVEIFMVEIYYTGIISKLGLEQQQKAYA